MARSWADKHDNHRDPARLERVEKPYAGIARGTTIVIATPKEMSDYFRSVPKGETRSMDELRAALAKKHGADAACPLTTGIFCRIAAEFAYERLKAGAADAAPFWRVIDPRSPLARKLACGADFIRKRRAEEGISDAPIKSSRRKKP